MKKAFTVIELLVVIAIIVIVIGILFAALRAIMDSGHREAGINVTSVSVRAARTLATNLKRADLVGSGIINATHDGVAVLFTPGGEIRFVENSQYAGKEGGGYMEPERNGYIDLSYIDYERLPKNTGIVGIVRGGDPPNNTLMLLAPPFALRFNRRGNLIVGVSQDLPDAHRLVFYDADYNGKYRSSGIGSSRSSPYGGITPYNPDLWDPRSHGYLSTSPSGVAQDGRHRLPFEAIETVIGVIIFDMADLRSHGLTLEADGVQAHELGVNQQAEDWILINGKVLLFSRLTGAIMRE